MADECLFCKIVRREIPARLVYEGDDCIAFRDVDPKAPVHILVVPRAHIPSLNEASDTAVVGRLSLIAAEIARQEGVAETGYRTVVNTNRDAGQTVFHLHLHLLGGRSLAWPPG